MSKTTKKTIRRKFEGVVVSDKGDKTIVVEVKRTKLHPKYVKRYITSRKYKVHDEKYRQWKYKAKPAFWRLIRLVSPYLSPGDQR